jgi:CheY-like chemotaxis protein
MIEKLGHKVLEARDGSEVVKSALEQNPDLILMDLRMPDVNGLQATRDLRAISHPRHIRNVPVVAITAYPETLSINEAFKAGCDAYLQKPITSLDLAAVFLRFRTS